MKSGFVAKSKWSTHTGMAGNYRVASELLLRGLNPFFPAVDDGVDLVVDGIVKVQVKSAHAMRRPDDFQCQTGYNFSLARGPKALGGGIATRSTPRIFSGKVDFVVLWGIGQNRFWIVPAHLLDDRMTIYLGPEGRFIPVDAIRIRQMLDAGNDQRTIAAALGVSEMTISRRIRKVLSEPGPVVAELIKIRECEGRWDHIQEAIRALTQADDIVRNRADQEIVKEIL